jgi:dTDP-4-amino-4,6-dideoxygalactose transaminase
LIVPFVDLKSQYQSIKTEIDNSIQDVIDNTTFIGGEEVHSFEQNFAEIYGVKHCVSVGNGTDAIYITLKMLGVGTGDEVITTAHSWISTSETISQTGAKPVFVDVEEEYFTINSELIEDKITSKTKAIIPVHIYGQMCDMDSIMSIAKKFGLYVIEDCAQSHFSEYKGTKAGLLGDAGTFSFYPGKNLGAYGDAGCIITSNDELSEKVRMFANHGAIKKHEHVIEGINSRLDGLQAAILNVKLKHINAWTTKRILNASYYDEKLKDIPEIILPKVRDDSKHSFHLYVVKVKERGHLKDYLAKKGISTAIHYPTALPLLKAYDYLGYPKSDIPISLKNQDQILSLPMYPELSKDQINYIVSSIHDFFKSK